MLPWSILQPFDAYRISFQRFCCLRHKKRSKRKKWLIDLTDLIIDLQDETENDLPGRGDVGCLSYAHRSSDDDDGFF